MQDTLDLQIQDQLARYVHHEISLNDFQAWLVRRSWNVHLVGNTEAERFTFAIEGLLAEYSNGDLTKDALNTELAALLSTGTRPVEFAREPTTVTGTGSQATVSWTIPQEAMTSPVEMPHTHVLVAGQGESYYAADTITRGKAREYHS